MGSCSLYFGVNPDNHRKAGRLEKPALYEPTLAAFCDCFPMFTFCFHIQLAAKQH
jgi:hypothetical protein